MIINNPDELLEIIDNSLEVKKEKLRTISEEQRQLENDIKGLEYLKLKLLKTGFKREEKQNKPLATELRAIKRRFTRQEIIDYIDANGPISLRELGDHYEVKRLNAFASLNLYRKRGLIQRLDDGRWAGISYMPVAS